MGMSFPVSFRMTKNANSPLRNSTIVRNLPNRHLLCGRYAA